MSVDRVRCETTSTQFVKWVEFLKRKRKEKKREFYYLAAIRFQVYFLYLSWVGQPLDKTIEDFLIEFEDEKAVSANPEKDKEKAWEEGWKQDQFNLFACLGIVADPEGRIVKAPSSVKLTGATHAGKPGGAPPGRMTAQAADRPHFPKQNPAGQTNNANSGVPMTRSGASGEIHQVSPSPSERTPRNARKRKG